jgi:hypothetical protein
MYGAAVRLAMIVSVFAVALAVTLESFGQLSLVRFVSFVFVVGFATSWTVTGRTARTAEVTAS